MRSAENVTVEGGRWCANKTCRHRASPELIHSREDKDGLSIRTYLKFCPIHEDREKPEFVEEKEPMGGFDLEPPRLPGPGPARARGEENPLEHSGPPGRFERVIHP